MVYHSAVSISRRSRTDTFLATRQGKAFTGNGFGNWFRDRCDKADLQQCSAHGLRKAGAAIAAENGATERQLMAIFGWTTMKEAARYTRTARQKLLAATAMGLLVSNEKSDGSVPLLPSPKKSETNSAPKLLKDNKNMSWVVPRIGSTFYINLIKTNAIEIGGIKNTNTKTNNSPVFKNDSNQHRNR